MPSLGPPAALALGELRAQWRIALALLLGAALVGGSLAAVPAVGERLRGLALRETLAAAPPGALEVRIARVRAALDRVAYREAQDAIDRAAADALGGAAGARARTGTTAAPALWVAAGGGGARAAPFARAALRFRSGLEDRVELHAGRFPGAVPRGTGEPIPVLLAADDAQAAGAQGIAPGSALILQPADPRAGAPIALVVAGLAAPRDPSDPYWGGRAAAFGRAPGGALALLVPETTFFGAIPDLLAGASAEFESVHALAPGAVAPHEAGAIAGRVRGLPQRLGGIAGPGGAAVESDLPRTLAGAGAPAGWGRAELALIGGQAAAAAGLLVFGAAAALDRRRAGLRAALRLWGASPAQFAAAEAAAAVAAGLAALAAGPPLAALAAAAVLGGGAGPTAAVWREAAIFAAAGSAAAIAIVLAAGPGRRRIAPGRGAAPAAAAAALGAGALFFALTAGATLFEPSADGGADVRRALLLAPLALLAPAALLARLLARGIARALAAPGGGRANGLREAARGPAGAAFPLALLAAAAAALLATLPPALERSPAARAAHAAGGDLRASGLRGLADAGEGERRAAIAALGADAGFGGAAPIVRAAGTLAADGRELPVEAIGVDPAGFGAVAAFRGGFSADPLSAILSALAANAASLEGVPIPADARQLGAWVRLDESGGGVRAALSLRNEDGGYAQLLLGEAGPPGRGWRFLAADLAAPLDPGGAAIAPERLGGRLTLHGYYLLPDGDAAAAPGSALLGAVLATLDPPAAARAPGGAFARRAIVHDLAAGDGLEPIPGPPGAETRARSTIAAPPGFRGSQRIDWDSAEAGEPAIRGLRQATDGAPVLLYVSRAAIGRLALEPGAELALALGGRTLRAQLAGELSGFPTMPAGAAFVVAGLDRLLAAANASPPGPAGPLATNEAWFASPAPARAREALAAPPLEAAAVADRESALAAFAADRAAAAGWRAALALALGALLAAAAAGALLDAAARGERRAEALAASEASGGSPAVRPGAIAAGAALRLGLAAAGGGAAGAALARWLLAALGRDAGGIAIAPPLQPAFEGGPVLAAALALAAIAAASAAAAWAGRRRCALPPRGEA